MKPLEGKIAVVAGATRGAGRGIARMLGEAGATVYCTGRGTRETPSGGPHAGRPETIEETAALVDEAGGTGIAARVDHAAPAEVAALFDRVRGEQGRLDVLVNVLGGPELQERAPLWESSLDAGRALLDAWVWPHVVTCRHALPLMIERRAGLVVEIVEGDTLAYSGQVFWDLVVTSLKRVAYAVAEEAAPHGVTALALAPGFMRTEHVLDYLKATEESWRTVARESKMARNFGFAGSETPCFVGRAVAALAADPEARRFSGTVQSSWGLSEVYGFTDVNGERPHWGSYFAANFSHLTPPPATGLQWQVAPPPPIPIAADEHRAPAEAESPIAV
jgi:NAD(P)-dependent dehydrogenase (short-subunit alcohol dehydrogenase family)